MNNTTIITSGSCIITNTKDNRNNLYMLGQEQYDAYVKCKTSHKLARFSEEIIALSRKERDIMWKCPDLVLNNRNTPFHLISVKYIGAKKIEIKENNIIVTKLDKTFDSYSDYSLKSSPDNTDKYIEDTLDQSEIKSVHQSIIDEINESIDDMQKLIDAEKERLSKPVIRRFSFFGRKKK